MTAASRTPVSDRSRERPVLVLRREGDRVTLVEPETDAWLSIDAENVFDPVALNDLP